MAKKQTNNTRFPLLAWLLLPVLGLWLTTNYLIGQFQNPSWQSQTRDTQSVVSAEQSGSDNIPVISNIEWQGQALLTFWFDDAWRSQYDIAFPILEKFGYKGALAVPTKLVGYEAYMNWIQISRLQYKGWEVDSHTRYHECDVTKLTPQYLESELVGARQDLIEQGLRADNFVTPCGREIVIPLIKTLAQKYYLSLRGTKNGINPIPVIDPYDIKIKPIFSTTKPQEVASWIQEAKQTKGWIALMFHQVDASKEEFSTTPETFEQIVQVVKNSGIQVALPTQVLKVK